MEFNFLKFDNMKTYPHIIYIPNNVYICRASGNDPKDTENPRWFSDLKVSRKYRKKYRKKYQTNLYICKLKQNIKLIDIQILRHLIIEIIINDENLLNKLMTDYEFYNKVENFMIAYGLKDRFLQVQKINDIYVSKGKPPNYTGNYVNNEPPFENFGSRISEGSVDDIAVELMKELVGDYIDGYICSKLKTQWHQHNRGYFDNEICLFNPKKCIQESIKLYEREILLHNYSSIDVDINTIIDNPNSYNAMTNTAIELMELNEEYDRMELDENEDPMVIGGGNDNLDNLDKLEIEIETKSVQLQCFLSKRTKLKNFIQDIFVKLTLILYESFKTVVYNGDPENKYQADIINNIYYHYRPIYDISTNKNETVYYVLKPGISNKGINLIEDIINNSNSKKNSDKFNNYTINELMGSIYGILTHGGMFTLIFKASVNTDNKKLYEIKNRFTKVINGIKELFSLNNTFDEEKFNILLSGDELLQTSSISFNDKKVYDVRKGNMKNIIMDMMVNNPQSINNISIVRKNLNNQDYIRTRRAKQINQESSYSKTSEQSKCPTFFTDDVKNLGHKVLMVDGDEWYEVTSNGFFKKIMEERGRIAKAGPSGSTFMWMNMIFGLMGVPATDENYKILLLCIICDFVPVYHSLTEVIMIYSKENPFVKNNYNIRMNPVKWLIDHFGLTEKTNDYSNINTVTDLCNLLNKKFLHK